MKRDLDILNAEANEGYLERPIPSTRDCEIKELLGSTITQDNYQQLESSLTPGRKQVLRAFAERMASKAVREKEISSIHLGLIALALGGLSSRDREAILLLPLLYRAAVLLDQMPENIFANAMSVVDTVSSECLRLFLTREDKSIQQMGYEEEFTPDGFKFQRKW